MKQNRVAVIGMSCRFAGAENPEGLWHMLMQGEEHSTSMEWRFPEYRQYYHPDETAKGKFYNKKAFFLKSSVELFDADFFRISHKEAQRMDYQQRMMLQISYEALMNAGIEIRGSDAGIFIGAFMQDFLTNTMQKEHYEALSGYHATGSGIGMIANRLSYFYDVHGPSMAVDTACSSSLTALHLACESIKNGSCHVALCGGINVMTEPGNFITLSKGGFLSPNSRCAAFGSGADGYARGEGGAVLVLKNLEEAVMDKDCILCEIVQTEINHDGNKSGITYPNEQAQEALLRKVYETGAAAVENIGYVEAHGTGTQAGDKVETEALYRIFGKREAPLYIGSIKTNIGHTEAAAGTASLIKGILMLKHGWIPPTLHCQERNPNLPFGDRHLLPVQEAVRLPKAADGRAYIGINGFGFGGSNAHVVIADCVVSRERDKEGEPAADDCQTKECSTADASNILYLSANSANSLNHLVQKYKYAVQGGELRGYSLEEICGSVRQRRPHDMPYRLAILAKDKEELARELTYFEKQQDSSRQMYKCCRKKTQKLMAVFSGMGIQHENMGKELYREFPVFREWFHACSQAYERYSGRSLEEVIKAGDAPKDFFRVGFLQPYNLAYQISLFKLLQSVGFKFEGCVGHSAGELAAFYCSGMLTLEETFRIAWHRGQCQELMQGQGRMLALKVNKETAMELCRKWKDKISLGVHNAQNDVVLSGDYEVLKEIEREWKGCFLEGGVAYHSIQMEPVRERFCSAVEISDSKKPELELYSTVYGKKLELEDYHAEYWWKNVRNTVEFYKAIQAVKQDGYDAFVEIGTTPVLSHYIAGQFQNRDFTCITVQTKRQAGGEAEKLYRGMLQAYVNQVPMDFKHLKPRYRMLPLPEYSWDCKILPMETAGRKKRSAWECLGTALKLPQQMWENRLNLVSHEWLQGHKIGKECYLPAAFYIAMLAEAGMNEIEELEIASPVLLDRGQDCILNLMLHPAKGAQVSAAGCSREDWRLVMQCGKCSDVIPENGQAEAASRFNRQRQRLTDLQSLKEGKSISKQAVYHILREKSLCYGKEFQEISEAWTGCGCACCRIPAVCREWKGKELTILLDAMLQSAALAGDRNSGVPQGTKILPIRIGHVRLYGQPQQLTENLFAYAQLVQTSQKEWLADIALYDENGTLEIELEQVCFKEKEETGQEEKELYTSEWEEIAIPMRQETDGKETAALTPQEDRIQKMRVYKAGKNWSKDIRKIIWLAKQCVKEEKTLLVVTENAVRAVDKDKVQNYRQAALWGAVRCLRLEQPEANIYLMDMDKDISAKHLSEQLVLPEHEYELAVRGAKIYGNRLQPVYEETDGEKKPADTAVITGASGSVAFDYALQLAKQDIRHIVLISRHQSDSIDILREVLGYYGVGSSYMQADVTDFAALERCWNLLRSPVYGRKAVYHLAGYNKDAPASAVDGALLEMHMQPKLEAAMHLSQLVRADGEELILIGSVTAILGNPGQVCYAAANMALQSFGEYAGHKVKGFGALNGGMAARSEEVRKSLQLQGIEYMESREAVGWVENCKKEVCYAARLDWKKLLKIRNLESDAKFQKIVQRKEQEDDFFKRYDAANSKEKEMLVTEALRIIYAEVLGMKPEELSPERNTDTMGIDSLNAAFISGRIRQKLECKVMPDMIRGSFTIRDMALRIMMELTERKGESYEK